jgi:hypothetical protein
MPSTKNVSVAASTPMERVVITLLIPPGGPHTSMALPLTQLSQAAKKLGGRMYVERSVSEFHPTT